MPLLCSTQSYKHRQNAYSAQIKIAQAVEAKKKEGYETGITNESTAALKDEAGNI